MDFRYSYIDGRKVLRECLDDSDYIEVPDDVEIIGKGAFRDSAVAQVELSEGLEIIEGLAFYECMALTDIEFPESLTVIGERAFMNCQNLSYIGLPSGIEEIGKEAFFLCNGLSQVAIPGSIYEMGAGCFSNCKNIEKVIFEDGVSYIGDSAFAYCEKLKEIVFPDSLRGIGDKAFMHCKSLTEVRIPESFGNINISSFKGCTGLRRLYCKNVEIADDEDRSDFIYGKENAYPLAAILTVFDYCSPMSRCRMVRFFRKYPEDIINVIFETKNMEAFVNLLSYDGLTQEKIDQLLADDSNGEIKLFILQHLGKKAKFDEDAFEL